MLKKEKKRRPWKKKNNRRPLKKERKGDLDLLGK